MSVSVEPGVPASTFETANPREKNKAGGWSQLPISSATLAEMSALIVLYALPALWCIRRFKIVDPDIWWHLATGRWILQHHEIPVTDPFSAYGMGKPWFVYSWVFDVVTQQLYRWFGFAGIVLYEVAVRIIVAVALYHLVRSLLPNFWRGIAITGLSLYAVSHVLSPRPGMLTILFSIVELDILLSARRTRSSKLLWLLPAMMLVWANWHIQFVYGLLLLGVFAIEPILTSLLQGRFQSSEWRQTKPLWIALGACVFATLLNPYGARIYTTVFQYMNQPKTFGLIEELRAMSFRQPQHFGVMFLALGAAMAIGWRRETRLLWPMLLMLASFVAFRSVKETWFLAVVSGGAIADGWMPVPENNRRPFIWRDRLFVSVGVFAMLVVAFRYYDVSNSWLEMQVAGTFPEASSQYIEKHHLTGPLFNDFTWGGFLIWRLPAMPVAMDGRTNVHGDERVAHDSAVWNGKPEWESDPDLARANIVIANKKYALTWVLRRDDRFKIVFEDLQAVVFQAR